MSSQNRLRLPEHEAALYAWQSEIARSGQTPWLARALAARVTDLLPRVARCHTQLRTLPRRTRRAWQRQLARSSDLTAILEDWSQRRAGRALQKQLARSVAGAALLLALAHGVGQAATITVTTNIPAINGADGKCSLIEAIANANDHAATHSDCAPGSGSDTIVLPRTIVALGAVDNATYGATGLPVITSQITIEGNGAKITRKGAAPPFRLIAVGATGDLTLDKITLSDGNADSYGGAIHNHGRLTIQNSIISGNKAGGGGGGITNDTGTLTIENSTISGNTVVTGNYSGVGGGIANYSGTVTITNSTISRNRVAGGDFSLAGGILNRDRMTIENSTISDNRGDGFYVRGGGIRNFGSLTITNSTISGNRAFGTSGNYGGGIENYGTMTVQNSTISGNKAGAKGGYGSGGPIPGNYGGGGGIANFGPATIENSTISGNTATGGFSRGGGILNGGYGYEPALLTITNSTISGNKARGKYGYGFGGGIHNTDALTLHRSLISGNDAATGPEVNHVYGTVAADDFNLFGLKGTPGVLGFAPGSTDIVPTVAIERILAGLKNNGGLTRTRALKPGSPAVNAVPSSDPGCTGTDQRGVARPQGGDCDIGAFELE